MRRVPSTEFEQAVQSAMERGTPEVLVFRKTAPVYLSLDAPPLQQAQLLALEAFWTRWFRSASEALGRGYNSFQTMDEFEDRIGRSIRSWIEIHVPLDGARPTWQIAVSGSPYRGLLPFDEAHAPVFFGRRREVDVLRTRLINLHQRGCPFLLVVGATGSGKTSLLRAGLIPHLLEQGAIPDVVLWHRPLVVRPGGLGGKALAAGLLRTIHGPDYNDRLAMDQLAAVLAADPDAAPAVIQSAIEGAARARANGAARGRRIEWRILMIVDQLEEIFSMAGPERETLVAALDVLVRANLAWIVAAMRSNAYGALLSASPRLVQLKEDGGQFDLRPPGEAQMQEIIQRPARAAGLTFGRDPITGETVDQRILRDADGGALPLVEFALDFLFRRRNEINQITFASYEAIGGLGEAISQVAEQTLTGLPPTVQDTLPRLLFALLRFSADGEQITLRDADLTTVATTPETRHLIDALIAARLLVAEGQDGAKAGHVTIRLAHEALLSHWPRARTITAANHASYRLAQSLEIAEARWRQADRSGDYLLQGRLLTDANRLLSDISDLLPPGLRDYLLASQHAQLHQTINAERQGRARLWRNVSFGVALGAFSVISSFIVLSGRQGPRDAQITSTLAADATGSLASLARFASGPPAAPAVAKALAVARSLARLHPDDTTVQANLQSLAQACAATKCDAP